jgi:hypothetical protein
MNKNDLMVGSLIRCIKPYRGESFKVIIELKEREFKVVDISGKFGFNTNGCCSGEIINYHDADYFEIVSTCKIIQLSVLGLFVNLFKRKQRTGY